MGNSINNIKFLGRKFFGVRNLNTTPVYDADAQAYFNANTAITSAADKNAINTFYLGLKSDGIYTKIKSMYLPIWGSAASCKWNLINPLDTNAAFRLTFTTGWTFSSGGMTPNGTSAYADTFIQPSFVFAGYRDDQHFSVYSRTNIAQDSTEFGAQDGSSQTWLFVPRSSSNAANMRINEGFSPSYGTNTDSSGLFIGTRFSSTQKKIYRNGGSPTTINQSANGLSTVKIWLSVNNYNNDPTYNASYSSRQTCFRSFGYNLTDTQASNFASRINTLMTYFGINTY